jgi:DNA-binding NarL/FixJ family response regulator
VTIQILLVDENLHESLLTATTLHSLGIQVSEIINNLADVTSALKNFSIDVLVISLDTDAKMALAIAEKARQNYPEIGLVLLTQSPDLRLVEIFEKELPTGVQVILKNSVINLHVLVDAIYRSKDDLKSGNKFRWVTGATLTNDEAFNSPLKSLTQVQVETLRLVAMGNSNSEIARIRRVTEKAVEHTTTRILQALSIGSNPRRNARVLLSREYYRWVGVYNKR